MDQVMTDLPAEVSDPVWLKDLAGSFPLKEGSVLAAAGAVQELSWRPPVLSGLVEVEGVVYGPEVDLKSRTFVRATCDCGAAKGGRICVHGLAVLVAAGRGLKGEAKIDEEEKAEGRKSPGRQLGSLRGVKPLSEDRRAAGPGRGRRKEAQPEQEGPLVEGSSLYLSISLPRGGHPEEGSMRELLKRSRFVLEPSNGRWWLRGTTAVAQFLAEEGERLWSKEWGCRFGPVFEKTYGTVTEVDLTIEIDERSGAVDYRWEVGEGEGRKVADETVRLGSQTGLAFEEGRILVFSREKRERARRIKEAVDGAREPLGGAGLQRTRIPGLIDLIEEVSPETRLPREWRERYGRLRDPGSLDTPPVKEETMARLRPYQKTGVAWLCHLDAAGLGGILADEMGLGKTVQALVAMEAILGKAEPEGGEAKGRGLVIAPAALLANWKREAARFAENLRSVVHHGSARTFQWEAEEEADVVITSYETLARDIEKFREIEWRVVVADEAQKVRNRRTQRARALLAICAESRFVLTGTPVENSMEDLISLFDFLLPGLLGRTGVERSDRWDPDRLQRTTAPYILRRRKGEVAKDLPERIEMDFPCEMGEAQGDLYRSFQGRFDRAIAAAKAGDGSARLRIFAELTRLRQICAEPRVIDPRLGRKDSAKAEALSEILEETVAGGGRLLVFSQFVRVLRIVESDLEEDGISTLYLDGKTRDRQGVCDRFNGDESIKALLISIQAGGTGLNLTGADTVVILDPWWNPAVEAQAIDRAHRIGQLRTVQAIRLVVPGTVEGRVRELQLTKAQLLKDLFEASEKATEGLIEGIIEAFGSSGDA